MTEKNEAATTGEVETYTCPHCGQVSFNPNDVKNSYCGACHKFQGSPDVWPSIEAQQRYWEDKADHEKMIDTLLGKLDKANNEIDRLRGLLRRIPASIGITEKDIEPHD